MPHATVPRPSSDLVGTWSGEVYFTTGPLEGTVHPDAWLFADDAILVQMRSRRGVGEWESTGDELSFAFYEVILDAAARPNGVVRVTASGTLAPDRSTFEAIGRGDVYGLNGELIATNHTAIRGRRASRPVDVEPQAGSSPS